MARTTIDNIMYIKSLATRRAVRPAGSENGVLREAAEELGEGISYRSGIGLELEDHHQRRTFL